MGRRDVSVIIVGAGVGGIATAVKLKRAGFEDFTVIEQLDGPGGTWWANTYPGCEVDVHSHFYSFSFLPNDWSRTHATQPELLRYVEDTIDHFGIRDRFRFGTRVVSAVWDDDRHHYTVTLDTGEELVADMVVSAVGLLSNPRYPDWPGLDDFEGPKFHTSRWEHEHDLRGRRIAFVGTGSTGGQVVPELAAVAGHLDVYQREPGWVLPKHEREYSERERRLYRSLPLWRSVLRYRQYRHAGKLLTALDSKTAKHKRLHKEALEYLDTAIHDPELRRALTPDYVFGCKRIVLSSTYYPALNRDNVTLVPHAVQRVTPTGVVAADGVERPADVLIMGTGFQAQNFLATLRVRGTGGRLLSDVWGDEPRALAGSMVPGFPNFFILYGPNTNGGGSLIYQLERSAEVAVRAAKRLRRTGARSIDTHPTALYAYVRWVDRGLARHMDTASQCNNYNLAPTGSNVVTWPRSHMVFHAVTRFVPRVAGRLAR
jgi:cation diffusion facilitator CzcD-associated flavoprotein CzcO